MPHETFFEIIKKIAPMTFDFQDCLIQYTKHGISFSYPDIWELHEEPDGNDVTISLAPCATSFWTLRIMPECPPPRQVVESCIAAFKEEYDDAEVSESNVIISEMPAFSREVEFVCMELTNSVGLASVRTTDFTILVWWQGTDHELEEFRPIFDHMTRSIQIDSLKD